jgi:hypothetical protein
MLSGFRFSGHERSHDFPYNAGSANGSPLLLMFFYRRKCESALSPLRRYAEKFKVEVLSKCLKPGKLAELMTGLRGLRSSWPRLG